MRYALDTNTLIYFFKWHRGTPTRPMTEHAPDRSTRWVSRCSSVPALLRHFWLCSIVTELPAWPTREALNKAILAFSAHASLQM